MLMQTVRRLVVFVLLMSVTGVVATASVSGAPIEHGIGVMKGCESPTAVGSPYACSYSITQDVPGDTATITAVTDNATTAGGTVSSGNILPLLSLTFSGGAACNVGHTSCTIPDGGEIDTSDYSYYTVKAADFGLPGHSLSDQVTVAFTEVCTGAGAANCPVGPQNTNAGSSTLVLGPTTTVTAVQQGGAAVTSVALGTSVTDQATVTGTATPGPTGTVTFTFFDNGTCASPAIPAGTGTLSAGVTTSSSEGPLAAGNYSFLAVYGGDTTYSGSTGACEPLSVGKAPTTTVTTVVTKSGARVKAVKARKGKKHATPLLSVPLGSTVMDQATVSGTGAGAPTGTVTFTFFDNGTCMPTGSPAGTPTLSAGMATSSPEGPLTAGTYSFSASYGGDSNYGSSVGACEPFTVATPPPPPCSIAVTVSPNPLVETGQSEIHGVIQVEACPSFAGDLVIISSSQLTATCSTLSYETVAGGLPPTVSAPTISVVLDDDGNATVVVDGINCAPGGDVIEADLEAAPYLTALTTLTASPPVTTTPGVTGYPNPEVETGDTSGGVNGPSGNSDVYAVFYVEDNPVYAEQNVEIGSPQLEGRCGLGWTWEPGNGGTPVTVPGTPGHPAGANPGPEPMTTLDDDGNAVFVFKGASCAAGDSTVIAEVMSGTHDTWVTTYTITAPEPTI